MHQTIPYRTIATVCFARLEKKPTNQRWCSILNHKAFSSRTRLHFSLCIWIGYVGVIFTQDHYGFSKHVRICAGKLFIQIKASGIEQNYHLGPSDGNMPNPNQRV